MQKTTPVRQRAVREFVAVGRLAFGLGLVGLFGVVHASSPMRSLRNGRLGTDTVRRPGEAGGPRQAGAGAATVGGNEGRSMSALATGAQEVVLANGPAGESFNQAQQEVAALP